MADHSYLTLHTVREKIAKFRPETTWREIEKKLSITGAMAYRIVNNDYEPHTAKIRQTLGMSPLVPAPACPRCGGVHVTARCTANQPRARRWVRGYDDGHRGGHYE